MFLHLSSESFQNFRKNTRFLRPIVLIFGPHLHHNFSCASTFYLPCFRQEKHRRGKKVFLAIHIKSNTQPKSHLPPFFSSQSHSTKCYYFPDTFFISMTNFNFTFLTHYRHKQSSSFSSPNIIRQMYTKHIPACNNLLLLLCFKSSKLSCRKTHLRQVFRSLSIQVLIIPCLFPNAKTPHDIKMFFAPPTASKAQTPSVYFE